MSSYTGHRAHPEAGAWPESPEDMSNEDLLSAMAHECYESGRDGYQTGIPGPVDSRYRDELKRRLMAAELSKLGHVMFGDEQEDEE